MTQITTSTERPQAAASASGIACHPADILMNLIVALLAPMFLGVSGGDIGFARLAAIETVNGYRIRNQADLVAVAQIIAFGLAALGSLSLSMADDISLSMALRLRGNANALNRSAEQNRRALGVPRGDDRAPGHAAMAAEPETPGATIDDADLNEAEVVAGVAASRTLAAEAQAQLRDGGQTSETPNPAPESAAAQKAAEQWHHAMWAIVMVKEAGELTASLPTLPASERRAALIRAAALSSAANELITGVSSRRSSEVGMANSGGPSRTEGSP